MAATLCLLFLCFCVASCAESFSKAGQLRQAEEAERKALQEPREFEWEGKRGCTERSSSDSWIPSGSMHLKRVEGAFLMRRVSACCSMASKEHGEAGAAVLLLEDICALDAPNLPPSLTQSSFSLPCVFLSHTHTLSLSLFSFF